MKSATSLGFLLRTSCWPIRDLIRLLEDLVSLRAAQNRMSKRGASYLRRAIWAASTSAVQFDPMFRAYYEKKRFKGQYYTNVIGHVSRKMTAVIFAVLQDSQPYRLVMPKAG